MNKVMIKPNIIIVGRPNVGKSTLFNRLADKCISIAHETKGTTRDIILRQGDCLGHEVMFADSGGMANADKNISLNQLIKQQITNFINNKASLVLFVINAKEGITRDDEEIASMLRRSNKPVLLVINKVDHENHCWDAFSCDRFGFLGPVLVSAVQCLGLDDLKKQINEILELDKVSASSLSLLASEEDSKIGICVVGKPNSGKSTFINAILDFDRVIVSDIPGTTIDAVDTDLIYAGKEICLVDTAGIRRKSSIDEDIEKMAVARSFCAIDRCSVAILMINAKEGISEQDQKIAGIISEKKKACVIAINQWDENIDEDISKERFIDNLRFSLPFLSYAPVIFISAKYRQHLFQLLDISLKLADDYKRRINTATLNKSLEKAILKHPIPLHMGRQAKMYFITQIDDAPPTFLISCSHPKDIHFSYRRYLANFFRLDLKLSFIPIRLILRDKSQRIGSI